MKLLKSSVYILKLKAVYIKWKKQVAKQSDAILLRDIHTHVTYVYKCAYTFVEATSGKIYQIVIKGFSGEIGELLLLKVIELILNTLFS